MARTFRVKTFAVKPTDGRTDQTTVVLSGVYDDLSITLRTPDRDLARHLGQLDAEWTLSLDVAPFEEP